jgi:hypothetical protein
MPAAKLAGPATGTEAVQRDAGGERCVADDLLGQAGDRHRRSGRDHSPDLDERVGKSFRLRCADLDACLM